MMISLRSLGVMMMMMLSTLRVAVMLLSVFYDVLKPKRILLHLRRVLLRVPVHLLAHTALNIVLRLAVNELQVICREVLRQVELRCFKGDKRLLGGQGFAFWTWDFEVGWRTAGDAFCCDWWRKKRKKIDDCSNYFSQNKRIILMHTIWKVKETFQKTSIRLDSEFSIKDAQAQL